MRTPSWVANVFVLAFAAFAEAAAGAEFRSIGDRPAVLYDAPSQKANKLYILGRSTPVEVLVKLERWSKVRDSSGDVAWIETPLLSEKRSVVVTSQSGEVRMQPNPAAAIVFEAQKQVLLEPVGPAVDGWIPVRHRDGQQGFIKISQVWGE
jgi:SH3-like domain-containing protein